MGRLLRAREVREEYGIPVSTSYALAAKGDIPHVRFGEKMVRFPEAELQAWLQSRLRQPKPDPAA